MDLTTNYLGLKLNSPLMPGASPMVDDMDMVRRLEDAAIELRDLLHVLAELRIELPEELRAHRPQHARVGVDRSRPHEEPRRGVDVAHCILIHGDDA